MLKFITIISLLICSTTMADTKNIQILEVKVPNSNETISIESKYVEEPVSKPYRTTIIYNCSSNQKKTLWNYRSSGKLVSAHLNKESSKLILNMRGYDPEEGSTTLAAIEKVKISGVCFQKK